MAIREIFSINCSVVSVNVRFNGWFALVDGKPCSMADIPSQYHSLIRKTVQDECKTNNWEDLSVL